MLVRAAVCIVYNVCALLLGFIVGILGLGFYTRAQVMCVAFLLARHLVAVMQGECACDHQYGRMCHQAAANPNSTCLAWFQHSSTPIKVCETVTPSFLSNVRRFYRSLFDCFSRWCFYDGHHNVCWFDVAAASPELQQSNTKFAHDSVLQPHSPFFQFVRNGIDSNAAANEVNPNSAASNAGNTNAAAPNAVNPNAALPNDDNPNAAPSNVDAHAAVCGSGECFSAASLTAHFRMIHTGGDLNAFVHLGFEKNCNAFIV